VGTLVRAGFEPWWWNLTGHWLPAQAFRPSGEQRSEDTWSGVRGAERRS
jgi:hypothetical protein